MTLTSIILDDLDQHDLRWPWPVLS